MSLALAQISTEFGLIAAELGIVLGVFYLGYAIMQLPGGWLADRFGSKFVVIATITFWSIFTVTTSLRLVIGLADRHPVYFRNLRKEDSRRPALKPFPNCSRTRSGPRCRHFCCRQITWAA